MKNMIWNQDTMSYRGECRDGEIVDVTGDEWSESVADGINQLISDRKIDREALTTEEDDALIEELTEKVEAELDDPDWWAALAGDNPNVEIVEATYTEEDYLKIVRNDNYGYNQMNGGW